MIDHSSFPEARKLRIPRGGWPSHCSEYVVDGESNRFRYCFDSFKVADGPPKSPNGVKRLFACVRGKRGSAIQLFEELPNRPL
jgi:hypothetical protein